MKKLTQALLLALVVAAPVAISVPQAQAKTATQQMAKASSKQQLAANTTAGNKAAKKKRMRRSGRKSLTQATPQSSTQKK